MSHQITTIIAWKFGCAARLKSHIHSRFLGRYKNRQCILQCNHDLTKLHITKSSVYNERYSPAQPFKTYETISLARGSTVLAIFAEIWFLFFFFSESRNKKHKGSFYVHIVCARRLTPKITITSLWNHHKMRGENRSYFLHSRQARWFIQKRSTGLLFVNSYNNVSTAEKENNSLFYQLNLRRNTKRITTQLTNSLNGGRYKLTGGLSLPG